MLRTATCRLYTSLTKEATMKGNSMMKYATIATALTTATNAFQLTPPHRIHPCSSHIVNLSTSTFTTASTSARDPRHITNSQRSSTRTFFSRNNNNYYDDDNNNDKDKSLVEKTKDKIKNLVPSFLKPKSMLTKKEKAKEEASSAIDTMLKDAPLGIRMMGKMVSPIISSVAGNMANALEEQSRQMNQMLDDARMYIVSDMSAIQELGEPIEVGSPFSQSSSNMSVNGKMSSSLNASFEVRGSRGSGVATMNATNGKIGSLALNINGRNLKINVSGSPSKTTFGSSSSKQGSGIGKNRGFSDDDIIDAEFVEKKVEK
jgi:hypothetical protein